MRILIADDEKPAREKILSFLNEEKNITNIEEADNGKKAIKILKEMKTDLVFLDIQMPGKTGFEVIEEVGVDNMPLIIFVTAYDQYALNAFEVQAIDYLLKPYDYKRFKKSFDRVLKKKKENTDNDNTLKKLVEDFRKEKGYIKKIMVKQGDRIFFIKVEEIIYISSEEKYINLHTKKHSYLIRETMNSIEQKLNPDIFVRTHRTFIVNTDYIKEIQSWTHGDYIIILNNEIKIKLSRRYSDALLKR